MRFGDECFGEFAVGEFGGSSNNEVRPRRVRVYFEGVDLDFGNELPREWGRMEDEDQKSVISVRIPSLIRKAACKSIAGPRRYPLNKDSVRALPSTVQQPVIPPQMCVAMICQMNVAIDVSYRCS
jgi:hypothetical protein